MTARFADTLPWLPIDDRARNGESWLVRCGEELAIAFWNGVQFIHPGTAGRPLDFAPIGYYDSGREAAANG